MSSPIIKNDISISDRYSVYTKMTDNVLDAISQAAAIQLGLDIIDKAILTDVTFNVASKMADPLTVGMATSEAISYIGVCFLTLLKDYIEGSFPSGQALNWVTQNENCIDKRSISFHILRKMSLLNENTNGITKFVDSSGIRPSVKYYMNIIASDVVSFLSSVR